MKKTIIILGAGFAGLNLVKKLGKNKNFKIILIDRRNYHLFQPLLYQVAMAGLSPAEIAYPIRSLMSKYENVDVYMAEVKKVNLKIQEIETTIGNFKYDYLVSALGAHHTVVWAAGVQASKINECFSGKLDGQGRIYVEDDLSL